MEHINGCVARVQIRYYDEDGAWLCTTPAPDVKTAREWLDEDGFVYTPFHSVADYIMLEENDCNMKYATICVHGRFGLERE